MTAAPVSLRERKKARTRASLIEVSQRLFAERGYAETTLEDICDEVEIRPKTLLRYFDSKAHLAFAPLTDPIELLRAHLDDPHRDFDAVTAWREYVTLEANETTSPTSPTTVAQLHNLRAFWVWADKDPVLVAMASDLERRVREVLASAFARDWGAEPGDLHVSMVAALLVAGRVAVWDRWLTDVIGDRALLAEQLAVIDYVMARLPRATAAHLLPDPDQEPS